MTSMRRIPTAALIATLCAVTAQQAATPPSLVNYQGVLKDKATGMPLNATVNAVFTFYPDPNSAGTDILSDTHAGVVVSNGLFSVQLGGGVLVDGAGPGTYASLAEVFRDFSDVWLEVKVGTETLSPRVRVAGAAYAMNASRLEGRAASEFIDTSGSSQYKSGSLQTSGLVANGIDATDHMNDYGPMYVGSTFRVDGAATLNAPLTVNAPIAAKGGLAVSSGKPLEFGDGTPALSGRSPQQIATLRWYGASTQTSFSVGSAPFAVAYDGSNIWVVNILGNSVTKMRAADGVNLGTFPAGNNPRHLAFDGSSIWVGNYNFSSVTKLRASDGANLGTFTVGSSPSDVAFDGSSIWVTNSNSNNVTKLRASDGASLGSFPVGAFPQGIAFDGSTIWVANTNNDTVSKL